MPPTHNWHQGIINHTVVVASSHITTQMPIMVGDWVVECHNLYSEQWMMSASNSNTTSSNSKLLGITTTTKVTRTSSLLQLSRYSKLPTPPLLNNRCLSSRPNSSSSLSSSAKFILITWHSRMLTRQAARDKLEQPYLNLFLEQYSTLNKLHNITSSNSNNQWT